MFRLPGEFEWISQCPAAGWELRLQLVRGYRGVVNMAGQYLVRLVEDTAEEYWAGLQMAGWLEDTAGRDKPYPAGDMPEDDGTTTVVLAVMSLPCPSSCKS